GGGPRLCPPPAARARLAKGLPSRQRGGSPRAGRARACGCGTDRTMTGLWIIHREPRERAALARLAADDEAVVGAPSDPRFDAAAPPRVVLLGLAGDFEAELELARRARPRLRASAWILVLDPRRL